MARTRMLVLALCIGSLVLLNGCFEDLTEPLPPIPQKPTVVEEGFHWEACPWCHGQGRFTWRGGMTRKCHHCNGKGYFKKGN